MAGYKTTGGCLCGGVKFEVTAPPGQVLNCHCTMCRKGIGAAYGTFAAVGYPNHFQLVKEDTIREYRSSDIARRMFCGTCGASLFIKYDIEPNTIWVAMATMNDDHDHAVECHIFTKYKAPWLEIKDGLPMSEEGDLWKEDAGKLVDKEADLSTGDN